MYFDTIPVVYVLITRSKYPFVSILMQLRKNQKEITRETTTTRQQQPGTDTGVYGLATTFPSLSSGPLNIIKDATFIPCKRKNINLEKKRKVFAYSNVFFRRKIDSIQFSIMRNLVNFMNLERTKFFR
jgi:hypothetical protein